MKVKDVLKIASMFVNLEKELENVFVEENSIIDEKYKDEVDLLLKCFNLAYQEISDYTMFKNRKVLKVVDGKVDCLEIDPNLKKVFFVKDTKNFKKLKYVLENGFLKIFADVAEVKVVYSVEPKKLDIEDQIDFVGVSEKCFALGVASEYFYIKSFYSEAQMFGKRFKDMLKIFLKKESVHIPKRRWE